MIKYIAFLRGINVGNIRIKMTDLQATFEALGFESVKTYLQTGNVVFSTDKTASDVKNILEEKLSQTFHYQAFVLIYEHEKLQNIITDYPMTRAEDHHAYVLFVESEKVFEELQHLPFDEEAAMLHFAPQHRVIYWKTKIGQTLDTPFAKIIAKAKYKSTTTMRNVNTLEKMM